jgi:hypothetical protein
MKDLTLIHYTANHLDKTNPDFARKIRTQIEMAAGDYPILSISHQPMDFGINFPVGDIGRSHLNIYRQLMMGAKLANTPFVAAVEDDVLYPASHFTTRRPPPNKFSYNLNGWGVNTWVRPGLYGYRCRAVINRLIAPRQLLVEALEERFDKYPDEAKVNLGNWGDLGRYEAKLGVTVREWEGFASPDPCVIFSHSEAFGYLSVGTRKSVGESPRSTLPLWGDAEDLIREYWEGETSLERKIRTDVRQMASVL